MVAEIEAMPKLERLSVSMEYNQVRPSFLYGPGGHGPGGHHFLTPGQLDAWREGLARRFSAHLPHLQQILMLGRFPNCSQATRTHGSAEVVVVSGDIRTMTHSEGFPIGVFD